MWDSWISEISLGSPMCLALCLNEVPERVLDLPSNSLPWACLLVVLGYLMLDAMSIGNLECSSGKRHEVLSPLFAFFSFIFSLFALGIFSGVLLSLRSCLCVVQPHGSFLKKFPLVKPAEGPDLSCSKGCFRFKARPIILTYLP